jgi:hypothetical protein
MNTDKDLPHLKEKKMKSIVLLFALSLFSSLAFSQEAAKKKVMHDKEHHHLGTEDHEHEDGHHKDHDHKKHHKDHDPKKAVGEDEHVEEKKK